MTTYISILVAIIAFSLIVVAHELGHFLAAKKSGILVLEFAIGMGPKLVSKQFGETVYSIRAFPIGGFCKLLGDDEECDDPRSFGKKSPGAKFFVLVAGAAMNFIFGIVLLFGLILLDGYSTNVVGIASPENPAYKAGLREGDRIVSIDGKKTHIFEDIRFMMVFSQGEPVAVEAVSGGEKKFFNITPEKLTDVYPDGQTSSRYILGISPVSRAGLFAPDDYGLSRASVWDSAVNSVWQFRFYVDATFKSLYMLVTGQVALSELSGFIGIGGAIVESIEAPINATGEGGAAIPLSVRLIAAVVNVLAVSVLITINLGIMNLLPFPALDGGRAVFVIIEGIRRKPIDQNKEGLVHFAGFVLLMLLMVFVAYNDIVKLFTGSL